MTKEEIQLELTKIVFQVKKPESGHLDKAAQEILDVYKQIGDYLSSLEQEKFDNKPPKA